MLQLTTLSPKLKNAEKELFIKLLEACKQAGINLEDFAKEARAVIYENGTLCIDDPEVQLKAKLIVAYSELSDWFRSTDSTLGFESDLGLFELEKAYGFSVQGVRLLEEGFKKNLNCLILTKHFVGEYLKPLSKIIVHLEAEKRTGVVAEELNLFVRESYTIGDLQKIIPRFASYIVRENIDESLEAQRKRIVKVSAKCSEPRWELAYQLAQHHCNAAALFATFDQKRAQEHLEKAKKEIDEHIWCYSFSWNRALIEKRKEEALSHYDDVKKKLTA